MPKQASPAVAVATLAVAVALLATHLAPPSASAQNANVNPLPNLSPCIDVLPRQGESEDAAAYRRRAIDALAARLIEDAEWMRTLSPAEGEAQTVSGAVREGEVILKTPVRHAEVGRLRSEVIAKPVFGRSYPIFPVGTEVWKIHQTVEHECRRWLLQMWCGRRPSQGVVTRPDLQCVMARGSGWTGIAAPRGSAYFPVGSVTFIESDPPEVEPLPSVDVPSMEFVVKFAGWRRNAPWVGTYVQVAGKESPTGYQAAIHPDARGHILSMWGGELLLTRSSDEHSVNVEVISPIRGYQPDQDSRRMGALAERQVDYELAKRARRAAGRNR